LIARTSEVDFHCFANGSKRADQKSKNEENNVIGEVLMCKTHRPQRRGEEKIKGGAAKDEVEYSGSNSTVPSRYGETQQKQRQLAVREPDAFRQQSKTT
jgi:hypothetical protein